MNIASCHKVRGMTLIELMIVIVVLAILGTLAVTSYRSYLIRANRVEAKEALLRVQVAQEKFFLQNNAYADDDELTDAPPDGLGMPSTTPKGYYNITLNTDGTSYTATATAINGQADDEACPSLTINERGQRTPSPDTAGCWR